MEQLLEHELINLVIQQCNVEGIKAEEIALDIPIIGPESPLDLDSLDALEIVVAVQKEYNVRIGGENISREILQSFTALADFIRDNQKAA
jgi:acyl carrier protein